MNVEYFLENWMPAGGSSTRQAFESDLAKLLLDAQIEAREAEQERIAKLIESQVWPKEYEMFPGFQSWKVTVEVLAKQVRES